jgi:hypothetical protein
MYVLEKLAGERRELLAGENAEQADKRDKRRRRRPDMDQAVEEADRETRAER